MDRDKKDKEIEKGFLEAYDSFADDIFRYAYLRVYNYDKAKDVVQGTFVKTWDYIVSGKKIDNFRPFLYRVARNIIIDNSRRPNPASLDMLIQEGFDAKDQGLDSQGKAMVNQILNNARGLEEIYRDAFLMRYVDGLSVKEIASVLGEKENAISVRIYRAIDKIKSVLE